MTDIFEPYFAKLYNNPAATGEEFRPQAVSVNGSDSVTGSHRADKVIAAKMMLDLATKEGDEVASQIKLVKIINCIQPILRRYDSPDAPFSRTARLQQLTARQSQVIADPPQTQWPSVDNSLTGENGSDEG